MSKTFYSENGYKHLNELLLQKKYSTIFVLTDSNTNEYCAPVFLAELATKIKIEIIEIEPGEEQKNINTCVDIWNILIELEADRKSLIIGLGGGVITDITGFIASVFKRGIDFVNIPTSLLGMVDAAIGGKNGIDIGSLKNQVGTITHAQLTLIDFRFLNTLPNQQIRSGYAEMLKHGLIQDQEYWKKLSDFTDIDLTELDELIIRSVKIKSKIVAEDLTEKGNRKALNFGHTLGHAIESYCLETFEKPKLLHGEAIAIGMILESFLSFKKGLISEKDYREIKSVLQAIYPFVDFDTKDIQNIILLLSFDKKNEYGNTLFVLLDKIGSFRINQIIENELIFDAFSDYKS